MRKALIILGPGYTARFLFPLAARQYHKVLATSREPEKHLAHLLPEQRLRFDLAQPATWTSLPDSADILCKAISRSENFPYDAETDTFICPANQRMIYQGARQERTENGYWTQLCHYEASACDACPFKPECTRAKGNRNMRVSFRLRRYREQAKNNLLSEQGKALRVQRNIEVESVFGHIKYNRGFRRFSLRGLEKAKTEWGLVCIAHNMRKLAG